MIGVHSIHFVDPISSRGAEFSQSDLDIPHSSKKYCISSKTTQHLHSLLTCCETNAFQKRVELLQLLASCCEHGKALLGFLDTTNDAKSNMLMDEGPIGQNETTAPLITLKNESSGQAEVFFYPSVGHKTVFHHPSDTEKIVSPLPLTEEFASLSMLDGSIKTDSTYDNVSELLKMLNTHLPVVKKIRVIQSCPETIQKI